MNKKDITTAVVVTYNSIDGKDLKHSGLDWYTSSILEEIEPLDRKKVVVFSDVKGKRKTFKSNGVLVDECWDRGKLSFWTNIIGAIKTYSNLRTIHFQHEFNQFGGLATIPLSMLLYFYLKKILKKNVLITIHGVISPSIINDNFTKVNNLPLPPFVVKTFFGFFYRTADSIADRFIVHEQKFKSILKNEYRYKKPVDIIPIGIEQKKIILTKDGARDDLGIAKNKKVILYFGFLAGYKGLDLLVDAFSKLKGNYNLVIAGGKPARVEKDKKYNEWFKQLQQKCNKDSRIIMTGFLPNEKLEPYFVASDLCVLPYLMPLAGSGAMSHAIVYKTPFIASEAFKDMVDDRFLFKRNSNSLKNKILDFFRLKNKSAYCDYVMALRNSRSWKSCAVKTNKIYKTLTEIPMI